MGNWNFNWRVSVTDYTRDRKRMWLWKWSSIHLYNESVCFKIAYCDLLLVGLQRLQVESLATWLSFATCWRVTLGVRDEPKHCNSNKCIQLVVCNDLDCFVTSSSFDSQVVISCREFGGYFSAFRMFDIDNYVGVRSNHLISHNWPLVQNRNKIFLALSI